MGVKKLAEAIIMQSVEDLWDEENHEESVEFLRGEGYHICADLAGIKAQDRKKFLEFSNAVIERTRVPKKRRQAHARHERALRGRPNAGYSVFRYA